MKKMYKSLLIGLIGLIGFSASTFAQSNGLGVQGVLRNPDGRTVPDGNYEVKFTLYDAPTGGTAVFSETYPDLETLNGIFQIKLGSVNNISAVPFDQIYYLGIAVEGRAEMTPRMELTVAPYAMAINGSANKFPSTGDVVMDTDDFVLKEGELRLEGSGGAIRFNDGTLLNTANFSGPSGSVANPSTIFINANLDGTNSDGNIEFQSNAVTNMMLLDNGNLGLGTMTPSAKFEINSSAALPALFTRGTSNLAFPTTEEFRIGQWDGTTFSPLARFQNTGYFAISNGGGTADIMDGAGDLFVQDELEVDGNARFEGNLDVNGTGISAFAGRITVGAGASSFAGNINVSGTGTSSFVGSIDVNGTGRFDGALDVNSTSDFAQKATFNNELEVNGILDVNSTSTFQGEATFSGVLDVNGRAEFGNDVGIGTTSPDARLHVVNGGDSFSGFVSSFSPVPNNSYFNFINIDEFFRVSGTEDDVAAIFEGDIIVAEGGKIIATALNPSDQRIKKEVTATNASEDLETLSKIRIVDYQLIDGGQTQKKVIAQEVKTVYPQAVSTDSRMAIPNVYELSEKVSFANGQLTITTAKAHDFVKGDKVNVFSPGHDFRNVEVLAVTDAHTFSIASEKAYPHAFVYGKYVNDFHAVDYDALAMLNISATQALLKRIEALESENATLKANNNELKASAQTQEQTVNELAQRLQKIEALLIGSTREPSVTSIETESFGKE